MFEYDVFLSYSSNNRRTVHALARRLKKDGVRVWLDSWVIQPGDSIPLKIQQGLEKSYTLLMCMSPDYFGSEWGKLEHQSILFRDPTNTKRRLIPLLIIDCTIPDIIAHFSYIDWRMHSNKSYARILDSCKEKESKLISTAVDLDVQLNDSRYHTENKNRFIEKNKEEGKLENRKKDSRFSLDSNSTRAIVCNDYGYLSPQERNKEIEEQYKLALENEPNNANKHINYGDFLRQMERKKEAEEQYKLALEYEPNNANAHNNYGLLLSETERKKEAEEQYKLALEYEPNNANTHSNYGVLLAKTGRKKEAEEHFKISFECNPTSAIAHNNYGDFLRQMGRKREAEEQYKLALEYEPNNANAHNNYGVLLAETGRKKEAEEHFKISFECNPTSAIAHNNYGDFLRQMGRKREAEEQYKLALEYEPNNANAHNNYGVLLAETGRKKEAEEHFKIAIKYDPKNINAQKNYDFLLKQIAQGKEAEKQKPKSNETNAHISCLNTHVINQKSIEIPETKKPWYKFW